MRDTVIVEAVRLSAPAVWQARAAGRTSTDTVEPEQATKRHFAFCKHPMPEGEIAMRVLVLRSRFLAARLAVALPVLAPNAPRAPSWSPRSPTRPWTRGRTPS